MTRDRLFKDSIRWLFTGDAKILQVLTIAYHLDQNGQGVYEEKWVDVPVVNSSEIHDEKERV